LIYSLSDAAGSAFRFAWLTDTHIGQAGMDTKLTSLVTALNALSPQPAFCVVTGDIADDGAVNANFTNFLTAVSGLAFPIYCTSGNHDQQAGETFTNWNANFANWHYVINQGSLSVVLFQTRNTGTMQGKIIASELTWLQAALAGVPGGNKIITMSHHPLGDKRTSTSMAINQAEGGSDLVSYMQTYGVKAHLAGHVHASRYDNMNYYTGAMGVTSSSFWGGTEGSSGAAYANGVANVCNVFDDRIEIDALDAVTGASLLPTGSQSYNLVRIPL
jgi:3',5'-cyclic AMP phosphodiesterase CpdA